jgi:microcystin-dependent protein
MTMTNQPPFYGEIRAFVGEIPDRGWLPCDGRQLDRDKWELLHHEIGTRFGGDGKSFNLPDLRGRVIAGADPSRQRAVGDTSGAAGEREEAIPYAVVNWAICVEGIYPSTE